MKKSKRPPEPERIDVSREELETIVKKVEASALDDRTKKILVSVLRAQEWIQRLLEAHKLSAKKLRRLFFGPSTEKAKNILKEENAGGQGQGESAPDDDDDASPPPAAPSGGSADSKPAARKGHGKNGANRYPDAERIPVPHSSLKAGENCPECEDGRLYAYGHGQAVRFFGRPPIEVKVYEPEKLRCSSCQAVFTADLPKGAGLHRHHHSSRTTVALLNYGAGMPFYRLEKWLAALGIALPDATQWDLSEELGNDIHPVYRELERLAAQGEVLHHDDTRVKILSLKKENESPHSGRLRKGMQTTGTLAHPQAGAKGETICLFRSGRNHAGENLVDLLKRRDPERPPPIQVADALSANFPKELRTIVQKCLDHARRKVVEISDSFPGECAHLIRELGLVYAADAHAKLEKMNPEQRLQHHVEHSLPVLKRLKDWMENQVENREVEPNSTLGHAFRYFHKHWEELTAFTRVPGAPLSNTAVERLLKRAVLRRKNSLFYRTEAGAWIGDVIMSVIETARAADINVYEYLNALQEHATAVRRDPAGWLPWNYTVALTATL